MRLTLSLLAASALTLLVGCGGAGDPSDAGATDAGQPADGGRDEDAGGPDAGSADAAVEDAGQVAEDAGLVDAGASVDASADAGPLAVTSFADTYEGWQERTGTVVTYDIVGMEPGDAATHPVFLYFVGTFGAHDSMAPLAWVDEMSSRGYVAATVEYDNGARFGCEPVGRKAMSIFSGADSALTRLCARPSADCGRGVLVAGHSQGSWIALQARDHDSRIEAALALGTGFNLRGPGFDLEQCNVTDRTISGDRVRAVNGASDGTWGPHSSDSPPGQVEQLNGITGQSCTATDTSCLRPDGSGWVLALDADVTDGAAEHCYYNDDAGGSMECGGDLDPVWLTTTNAWGRSAGADWLASRVAP